MKKTEMSELHLTYVLLQELIFSGKFRFNRNSHSWIIEGNVPLKVAQELYATESWRKDIRVAGQSAGVPPEQWAFPTQEKLASLGIIKKPCKKYPFGFSPTYKELAQMCNEGKIDAPRFVQEYHIDSDFGLEVFVNTMAKHGLI